jgi:hypothetical protein
MTCGVSVAFRQPSAGLRAGDLRELDQRPNCFKTRCRCGSRLKRRVAATRELPPAVGPLC